MGWGKLKGSCCTVLSLGLALKNETPLYEHPFGTDTLLLRTVCFVRGLIRTLFMVPSVSVSAGFDFQGGKT